MIDEFAWVGIVFCITQSAMFSGLNLAFFGLSRLRLEAEAQTNERAQRILSMRQDAHFLLATILWGNVSVNVLLALLSNSVMAGAAAFFFSTILITFLGEILPQAYFSRHAMQMASLLAPVLRMYQFIMYPVAKPSARLLDWWLGPESVRFLSEDTLREMLDKHIHNTDSDVGVVEGTGAMNFLDIDDALALDEGEPVDPASLIRMEIVDVDLPRFPQVRADPSDPFLAAVNASGRKWVVLADDEDKPLLLLDTDDFVRRALFSGEPFNPYESCHRPIVVDSRQTSVGEIIELLQRRKRLSNGVLDHDVVLVWTAERRRIITGADLLERLLRGIG